MPGYDRQVIAQFLCGDPSDNLIRDNAKAINDKANSAGLPSVVCTIPIANQGKDINDARWWYCGEQMKKLTADSRLYLQGHGNWKSQKLGDWGPVESADLLVGLGMKACKMISILGCELGSDRTAPDSVRVLNSADSFASRFHKALKDRHRIETEVYARIWPVVPVGPAAQQVLALGDEWSGKKLQLVGGSGDTYTHHAGNTKIRFYWSGGVQQRQWAY